VILVVLAICAKKALFDSLAPQNKIVTAKLLSFCY